MREKLRAAGERASARGMTKLTQFVKERNDQPLKCRSKNRFCAWKAASTEICFRSFLSFLFSHSHHHSRLEWCLLNTFKQTITHTNGFTLTVWHSHKRTHISTAVLGRFIITPAAYTYTVHGGVKNLEKQQTRSKLLIKHTWRALWCIYFVYASAYCKVMARKAAAEEKEFACWFSVSAISCLRYEAAYLTRVPHKCE